MNSQKKSSSSARWVWLDLEMSGLNPAVHRILEIATVITDPQLNVISEGPVLAIHQPDEVLDAMDEWCTTTHGKSGLTERVRASTISEEQAQQMTLDYLQLEVQPNTAPLCGNSIWQDRRFLIQYMPPLAQFFHYRNLDVSSLKILAQQWDPDIAAERHGQGRHRALDDIYDSIAELKWYREKMFQPKYRQNRR